MTMPIDLDEQGRELLAAFYQNTGGDTAKSAAMWEIGEQLGWDRAKTEDVSMLLVSLGLMEIKTLSGAMGLTSEGASAAGSVSAPIISGSSGETDLKNLADKIEAAALSSGLDPAAIKNMEIDAGVLRLQADRNGVLAGVVLGVLEAVKNELAGAKTSSGSLVDEIERALAAFK